MNTSRLRRASNERWSEDEQTTPATRYIQRAVVIYDVPQRSRDRRLGPCIVPLVCNAEGCRFSSSQWSRHSPLLFLHPTARCTRGKMSTSSFTYEPRHRTCVPNKSILRSPRRRSCSSATSKLHFAPELNAPPIVELDVDTSSLQDLENGAGQAYDMACLWEQLEAAIPSAWRGNGGDPLLQLLHNEIENLWEALDVLTAHSHPEVEGIRDHTPSRNASLSILDSAHSAQTPPPSSAFCGSGVRQPPPPLTAGSPFWSGEEYRPPTSSFNGPVMFLGNAGYVHPPTLYLVAPSSQMLLPPVPEEPSR